MKFAAKISMFGALAVASAVAQNWTTVTASNITDLNQQKLAAGQMCLLVTDQTDTPISVNIGGGGQSLKRPYCATVTNGAVSAFTVPNPASTQPSGIYYRITVKDSSTGLEVLRYTQVTFTGGSFSFDNFMPTGVGQFNPLTGNSVTGNLSVSGNETVTGNAGAANYSTTGTVTAGALSVSGAANVQSVTASNTVTAAAHNVSTRGDRAIILQNPDFEGSSVIPPPGWTNGVPGNLNPPSSIAYETSTPAPNKLQSIKLTISNITSGIGNATRFSVVPGDTYSIAGIAKSDGTLPASIALMMMDKNGLNQNTCFQSTTSTSWTQLTATCTIGPSNIVQAFAAVGNMTGSSGTVWFDQISVQHIKFPALALANLLISSTAPTISSGFGTSPSVTVNNGTADFRINVGTGGTASSGVIGLPTAVNGWDCDCEDRTTFSTTVFKCRQTADTTTTATVGNFNSSAVAVARAASDVLAVKCHAR